MRRILRVLTMIWNGIDKCGTISWPLSTCKRRGIFRGMSYQKGMIFCSYPREYTLLYCEVENGVSPCNIFQTFIFFPNQLRYSRFGYQQLKTYQSSQKRI